MERDARSAALRTRQSADILLLGEQRPRRRESAARSKAKKRKEEGKAESWRRNEVVPQSGLADNPPPLLFVKLRCIVDNRVTRVAWLNRSSILYTGNDKWCLDPRVELVANTKTHYAIQINDVDVYDEGPYTCSVQTDNHPKTSRVHLIVQGKTPGRGTVELFMEEGGGRWVAERRLGGALLGQEA